LRLNLTTTKSVADAEEDGAYDGEDEKDDDDARCADGDFAVRGLGVVIEIDVFVVAAV
jgi:hypothetical protein